MISLISCIFWNCHVVTCGHIVSSLKKVNWLQFIVLFSAGWHSAASDCGWSQSSIWLLWTLQPRLWHSPQWLPAGPGARGGQSTQEDGRGLGVVVNPGSWFIKCFTLTCVLPQTDAKKLCPHISSQFAFCSLVTLFLTCSAEVCMKRDTALLFWFIRSFRDKCSALTVSCVLCSLWWGLVLLKCLTEPLPCVTEQVYCLVLVPLYIFEQFSGNSGHMYKYRCRAVEIEHTQEELPYNRSGIGSSDVND